MFRGPGHSAPVYYSQRLHFTDAEARSLEKLRACVLRAQVGIDGVGGVAVFFYHARMEAGGQTCYHCFWEVLPHDSKSFRVLNLPSLFFLLYA